EKCGNHLQQHTGHLVSTPLHCYSVCGRSSVLFFSRTLNKIMINDGKHKQTQRLEKTAAINGTLELQEHTDSRPKGTRVKLE
ncbi:hypothetical protein KSS87_016471, partial [Heliosperma pusillum]